MYKVICILSLLGHKFSAKVGPWNNWLVKDASLFYKAWWLVIVCVTGDIWLYVLMVIVGIWRQWVIFGIWWQWVIVGIYLMTQLDVFWKSRGSHVSFSNPGQTKTPYFSKHLGECIPILISTNVNSPHSMGNTSKLWGEKIKKSNTWIGQQVPY